MLTQKKTSHTSYHFNQWNSIKKQHIHCKSPMPNTCKHLGISRKGYKIETQLLQITVASQMAQLAMISIIMACIISLSALYTEALIILLSVDWPVFCICVWVHVSVFLFFTVIFLIFILFYFLYVPCVWLYNNNNNNNMKSNVGHHHCVTHCTSACNLSVYGNLCKYVTYQQRFNLLFLCFTQQHHIYQQHHTWVEVWC